MSYVIDYVNENEFRKLECALKKYNMLVYKKLLFEHYPNLREGKFDGTLIFNSKEVDKYKLNLPTETSFLCVSGQISLIYSVYKQEKVFLLEEITPKDFWLEGGEKTEFKTYKGVMISKNHAEKDMFKINLLNMMTRDGNNSYTLRTNEKFESEKEI